MTQGTYYFGHSDTELRRLAAQGEMLRPITERLLRAAGLAPGMRVLDVGCGAGDVAMLAAALVGPAGSVVGVDRSGAAVELARHRAAAAGLANVEFVPGDLAEYAAERGDAAAAGGPGSGAGGPGSGAGGPGSGAGGPGSGAGPVFDAATIRCVLMHQADPVAVLRQAVALVRPGGVVACHEMDGYRPYHSAPRVPLVHQVEDWLMAGWRTMLPHADAGGRLVSLFRQAGLPSPALFAELIISGPGDPAVPALLAGLLRGALPVLTEAGIVTPEQAAADTLEARLTAAIAAADSQVELAPQTCAWARVPQVSA
jgi:SAM-dependent methyltransferase